MLGFSATDATGVTVRVLATEGHEGDIDAALRDIGRGCAASRLETMLRHRDGTKLPAMVIAAPVRDAGGRLIGASLVVRDLTAARRVAAELEAARGRLATLEGQLGRLSRLSGMERITLNLAHELNQPLGAIANYVRAGQRLLADPAAAEPARLADALDGALAQAAHAAQIVRSVRDYLANGETERRIEALGPLLEHGLSLALPATVAEPLRISLAPDPAARFVLVDPVQVHQVLINLIRNAVAAMAGCSRRELSIASRRRDGMVEISVADTGPGLPADLRDRAFEPFVTSRPGGTGLGLTICRLIVEAHGGTLTIDGRPEGGSVFRFTVPWVEDQTA
jgi:two-component system sensor kinase FixL